MLGLGCISIGVAKLCNGQAPALHVPPATWQIVGALAGKTSKDSNDHEILKLSETQTKYTNLQWALCPAISNPSSQYTCSVTWYNQGPFSSSNRAANHTHITCALEVQRTALTIGSNLSCFMLSWPWCA